MKTIQLEIGGELYIETQWWVETQIYNSHNPFVFLCRTMLAVYWYCIVGRVVEPLGRHLHRLFTRLSKAIKL